MQSNSRTHPEWVGSRAHDLGRRTAGEHERDARRRYQAAVAAAFESLRRAERRFDEVSAAIDAHIDVALAAAVSLTGPIVATLGLERRPPGVAADSIRATGGWTA